MSLALFATKDNNNMHSFRTRNDSDYKIDDAPKHIDQAHHTTKISTYIHQTISSI
jgi:hypothetical protein